MMSSRSLLRGGVCVGGFLLFCCVSVAHAADAAATVIEQGGRGATALFSALDSTGCISSTVLVIANDNSDQTRPDAPVRAAQVAVVVSQVDLCAVIPLLTGNGVTTDAAILVAPNLESASVNAVVPVLNLANGTMVDVSVDVTFYGTSPIQADAGEELDVTVPGYRINTTFHQTFRQAAALGEIATVGGDLVSGPSLDAMIQNVRVGTVVVRRE